MAKRIFCIGKNDTIFFENENGKIEKLECPHRLEDLEQVEIGELYYDGRELHDTRKLITVCLACGKTLDDK